MLQRYKFTIYKCTKQTNKCPAILKRAAHPVVDVL